MQAESKKPLRVLHITEELSAAGIESFIFNIYRQLDRSQIQFDFLLLRNKPEFYDEEVKRLGGHKYWIHSDKGNTLLRILDESQQLKAFIKDHPYDIVHIHYTTPLRAPYTKALKEAGVKTVIYHSHSAAVEGKSWLKKTIYHHYQKMLTKYADAYFACSQAAAEWMFEPDLIAQGKVRVFPNGIDIGRFQFRPEKRKSQREKLGAGSEPILVHTGRLSAQKNQLFLLDLLKELRKEEPEARLILIGQGEDQEKIEARIQELNLQEAVLMTGVVSNVEDYLFAADCYVMPSLYEGLPVAGIEALCTGIPCLFSANITEEVNVTGKGRFLSLDAPLDAWVKAVQERLTQGHSCEGETIRKAGYSVADTAEELSHFYLQETGHED